MGILQHTQMFRHDPENGVYGDCWRATVASLLRLPIDAVPHVCNGPDDGKASERMRAYLESQNCALIQVPFNGDMSLQQILDYVGAISVSGGLHWCLMGTSRTGCNHVVICKGAEIIHDPSITQSGIVGPADDGLWWVEWVVQRAACDSPSANPLPNGVYGPYVPTFIGPAVWAAITDELPAELVDKKVWITTAPPANPRLSGAALRAQYEKDLSRIIDEWEQRREVCLADPEAKARFLILRSFDLSLATAAEDGR